MRQNRKWKIPHSYVEMNHVKLKARLWWVGARERKKSAFFVKFMLLEGNFCNICVLSQCIVYWTNFKNIYSKNKKHIEKHYFEQFCCLLLKSLRAFSAFLKMNYFRTWLEVPPFVRGEEGCQGRGGGWQLREGLGISGGAFLEEGVRGEEELVISEFVRNVEQYIFN